MEKKKMDAILQEKVRSGQSYLYRSGGIPCTVFDLRMKDRVNGTLLQKALNQCLQRYPYLKSKLREEDGDFYYAANPLPCMVKESDSLFSLGSAETNFHLIDITYKNHTISIAFHHGLCDGLGIMPLIETLMHYYCLYKYNNDSEPIGIRLAEDPLLEGETTDPFSTAYEVNSNASYAELDRDGFCLPETTQLGDRKKKYYRYEMNLSHDDFMRFAKENNATPAIAATLIVSKAISLLYPLAEKPIVCNMASDMRKELLMKHTFKNCVRSLVLPYTKDFDALPLSEQALAYRRMLQEQKSPDHVRNAANNMMHLNAKLDQFHSFSEKKKLMSFFDDLHLNTYIISYLGQTNLGIYRNYIDSLHLYSSGNTGLTVNMLSTGNCFSLDFIQSFNSEIYVKACEDIMNDYGIHCSVSDCIAFVTPKDSVQKNIYMEEPAAN